MTRDYADFINAKAHSVDSFPVPACGEMLAALKPHQADIVRWAMRRGRAAVFADTGLGKTLIQLEWARHASAEARVLILAPLAVAEQTVAEAHAFGIVGVRYLRADDGETRIVVTNYEMLTHFNPDDFGAVVLDESSILKAFDGKTRTAIIDAFRATPWRLACTATPAPNDFTELGNHSEFLGVRTRAEMLSEFFYHDGGETSEWTLKGHAEDAFWRWVCAWACIVKRPSDLGHSDEGFALPPLRMHHHPIVVSDAAAREAGMLFAEEARSLSEQRATRRATMDERVRIAASLCGGSEPALVWCELNAESEAVTAAITGAVEVAGSDAVDVKAERLLGFAAGRYRVMVTKPSIAGFGLNWQQCARIVFVGASHSYEQTYQAIRRCWRFGQKRPVDVHMIYADTEGPVIANYQRKERDAERLAAEVLLHMGTFQREGMASAAKQWDAYAPALAMEVPTWLR